MTLLRMMGFISFSIFFGFLLSSVDTLATGGKHQIQVYNFDTEDSLRIKEYPLLIKATSAYKSRNFDEAILYAEKSLLKLDSINDIEIFIQTQNLLGASYIRIRSLDKAFSILSKVLKLTDKLKSDHYLVGDSYYNLGLYYRTIGGGHKALYYHNKALDNRIIYFGPNHLKVAESYNGIGEVYTFNFFNYKKAVLFYENSVKIREVFLDPGAYELYASYFNLSQVYRMLEDGDKAFSYAFKALTVVKSRKEHYSLVEKCHMLLGDIYAGKLDYPSALEYFKKAMNNSIVVFGPENYRLISSYTSLGLAYGELNEWGKAIHCFEKSLDIYTLRKVQEPSLQANNFLHIGRMFQKIGDFESAKFFLKKNLNLRLSYLGPKSNRTSAAYSYLAKLFQEFKQLDSATFYIQKALIAGTEDFNEENIHINPLIDKTSNPYDLFELFGDKGSILLDSYTSEPGDIKNLTSSLACFKIADSQMELNRSAYHQEGSKLFFADHYHHIYENALQAAYLLFDKTKDQKYFADAIMFMEKSKAILLAESLNKAEIFTQVGLPDSIREMEKNLNSALTAYRSQLETYTQKTGSEAGQQQIQSQIFQISLKQEKLLDTITKLYPHYFQIRYQKLNSLNDIMEYARKNKSTIIEYFWGDKRLYFLALSGEKMVFEQISNIDSLTKNILQYSHSLQEVPAWNEKDEKFQSFYSSGYHIYNAIIAPLLQNVNSEKLILIRDGPLLLIPFESLPVSKTNAEKNDYQQLDYLLRHHTISYAHSADILIKNSLRLKTNSEENKVLAFSYSQLNPSQKDLAGNRSANELPGAAREIHSISQILPGLFLEGEEATEQKFKMHAGDFDILHLAVHGRADPEKQFSGSLFFKQSQDKEDDGELHVYELYDMSLKARLTVLSACESGVGKIFRGEGVFSIARAFAYAGCPSTVMTLWPISDLTSAEIMSGFYGELKKGKDIDVALRKAKLNYLENADNKLSHPAYWAAYIPIGNMESVVEPGFRPGFLWALMFIVVGVFGVLILWKKYLKNTQRRKLINRI